MRRLSVNESKLKIKESFCPIFLIFISVLSYTEYILYTVGYIWSVLYIMSYKLLSGTLSVHQTVSESECLLNGETTRIRSWTLCRSLSSRLLMKEERTVELRSSASHSLSTFSSRNHITAARGGSRVSGSVVWSWPVLFSPELSVISLRGKKNSQRRSWVKSQSELGF